MIRVLIVDDHPLFRRAQPTPIAPVVLTMHREESPFDAAISQGAAGAARAARRNVCRR